MIHASHTVIRVTYGDRVPGKEEGIENPRGPGELPPRAASDRSPVPAPHGPAPQSVAPEPFRPGELLAGRFRIMRRLAQGSLGMVYEAMDQNLGRRIALKCAPAGYLAQLAPDVRLAAEVSHPNICAIFEIRTVESAAGPVDFVTMELVEGPTLAARLRAGKLPELEARAIALQLCAGLAEAHRHQVMHGDLKPSNIILARAPAGRTGLRAVITDFGLARGAHQGTPGYLSPELSAGAAPTVASDIYALGVILRELAAGVGQAARAPGPLGTRWDPIIQRCLAADPTLRYQSVDQVATALGPSLIRRRLLVAAGGLVLAALAAFGAYRHATAPPETVTLGVFPLKADANLADSASQVDQDIYDQLSRLKNSRRVAFSVVRPGRFAGATHRLAGSLSPDQGNLRLSVELRDIRSDTPLAAWSGEYTSGQLHYAPVAVAALVSSTFHLPPSRQFATLNESAATRYHDGLALARQDAHLDRAVEAFGRAIELDPDSVLPYAALAEAQWRKYILTKDDTWLRQATESVRVAELRNGDVAEVHTIAGLLEANTSKRESAIVRLKRALELASASSGAYEHLGEVYQWNQQYPEALQAYLRAVAIEPNYFRNHEALASLYDLQASYAEAAAEYQTALRQAPDVPRLYGELATSLQKLGRFEEAEGRLREALRLDAPDEVAYRLGHVLLYQGKDQDATTYLQRALDRNPQNYLAWIDLAVIQRRAGRAADARSAFQHALALADAEVKRVPGSGVNRSILAFLCAQTGDPVRAGSEAGQAFRLSPSLSDTIWWTALTYETLGRRAQALQVLERAPYRLLEDLARWPGAAALAQDPQFQSLLSAAHRSQP